MNFSFTSPSSYPELCLVEEQLCRISRDPFSRLEAKCGMNLLNWAWQALDEALTPLCWQPCLCPKILQNSETNRIQIPNPNKSTIWSDGHKTINQNVCFFSFLMETNVHFIPTMKGGKRLNWWFPSSLHLNFPKRVSDFSFKKRQNVFIIASFYYNT